MDYEGMGGIVFVECVNQEGEARKVRGAGYESYPSARDGIIFYIGIRAGHCVEGDERYVLVGKEEVSGPPDSIFQICIKICTSIPELVKSPLLRPWISFILDCGAPKKGSKRHRYAMDIRSVEMRGTPATYAIKAT